MAFRRDFIMDFGGTNPSKKSLEEFYLAGDQQ
jgi:hypothetical protein